MAARKKSMAKSSIKRKQGLQTPKARGKRATVTQADSILKWWRYHSKDVPLSNKLLIADIKELARLLKWVKGLEAKKDLQGTEEIYLAKTKTMLKAAVIDVAAELKKLEDGKHSFIWDPR